MSYLVWIELASMACGALLGWGVHRWYARRQRMRQHFERLEYALRTLRDLRRGLEQQSGECDCDFCRAERQGLHPWQRN